MSASDLHRILSAVPVGILLVERSGQVCFANTKASELLGMDRADILGSSYQLAGKLMVRSDGRSIPPAQHPISVALRLGMPVSAEVLMVPGKVSSQKRWLLLSVSSEDGNNGAPGNVIVTLVDVSELLVAERMSKSAMPARCAADVMSSPVVTIKADGSVQHAAKVMLERRVGCLPVVDQEGTLVGMLRESVILSRLPRSTSLEALQISRRSPRHGAFAQVQQRYVREVMEPRRPLVDVNTTVSQVADLMLRQGESHVVVGRSGQLAGMISRCDMIRVLAQT